MTRRKIRSKNRSGFCGIGTNFYPVRLEKGIGRNLTATMARFRPSAPFTSLNCSPSPVLRKASTNVMYEIVYSWWLYEYQQDENGVYKDPKNLAMCPKYSDCKVGQNKWGGWGTAGRKRHYELLGQFKEARKSKYSRKVEDWALKALREQHNIADKEAKHAMKGRKHKINEVGDDGYVEYVESCGEEGSEEENELGDDEEEDPPI